MKSALICGFSEIYSFTGAAVQGTVLESGVNSITTGTSGENLQFSTT